jgi:hypothetical protein
MSTFDNVRIDLEDLPIVPFSEMLKALLARSHELEGPAAQHPSHTQQARKLAVSRKYAEKHFTIMAESAVRFCNDAGAQSSQLKESLRSWYAHVPDHTKHSFDSSG